MGRIKEYIKHLNIPFWYALLVIFVCVACCTSCKTKYVTVPEYHTSYTHNTDTLLRSDTMFVRDSVIIRMQGDTMIVEKIKWRDRIIKVYKIKTDTVIQRDTVVKYIPITNSDNKSHLNKLETIFLSIGKLTIAIGFIYILIQLIKHRLKLF